MKDTALAAAKEMIKTMEGLADGLQERLRRTEAGYQSYIQIGRAHV